MEIIGNNPRSFYPKYAALLASDDQMAEFYTDPVAGRWVEKAIRHASSNRYNVVLEGAFQQSDVVAATMTRFRQGGYRADARVLAVSKHMRFTGACVGVSATLSPRSLLNTSRARCSAPCVCSG